MIRAATLALVLGAASLGSLGAQQDSVRCDSVIGAAKVDEVPSGLFLSVQRMDGTYAPARAEHLVNNIGAAFYPPKPFTLNVFSGPSRPRLLRSIQADTAELRAPTVTGVYRVTADKMGQVKRIAVIRPSLMKGFDSAAVTAIRAVAETPDLFAWPDESSTTILDVRFSTDSAAGARRLVAAVFPRMRIADASPASGNPRPTLPDSVDAEPGEVVFRFVVHRDGTPDPATVEVIRSPSVDHALAALRVLSEQRFRPATIGGCAIAQRIDYVFVFNRTEPPKH